MLKRIFVFVLFFVCFFGFAFGDIDSGLVGWWKLDGDSLDSVRNEEAIVSGDPVYAAGVLGEGLDFDGVDDYLAAAYQPVNKAPFSISCWVKVQGGQGGERTIVSSMEIRDGFPEPGRYGYALGINSSNQWVFEIAAQELFGRPEWVEVNSYVYAELDTWAHIAVVVSSQYVRLYVNGVMEGSDRFVEFMPYSSEPLIIGAGSDGDSTVINFFDGQLDDIRIYGRALPDEEVRGLVNYRPVESPSPAEGATGMNLDTDLGWAEPGGIGEFYDYNYLVYFDTVNPPTVVVGNHGYWDKSHVLGTLEYETTYYWKVDKITGVGTVSGPVWSFTTYGNAESPQPGDGAIDIAVETDLSWTGYEGAESHTVYFGTENPPVNLVAETVDTTAELSGLDPATMYYWRVDENFATGTVSGGVWSFTTSDCKATTPRPGHGTGQVNVDTQLEWTGYENAVSHTVYFGTEDPPVNVLIAETSDTTVPAPSLEFYSVYYWRVDENISSGTITGDVWRFSTALFAGSGTEADPFQIGTFEDLQVLSQSSSYWGGGLHFVLVDDIDCPPGAIINAIGNTSKGFGGVFDGDGHCIDGFTRNGWFRTGLFGITRESAVISNLSVRDATLNITEDGGDSGIVVGWNDGQISNCHVSVTVTATHYAGRVGGLVGVNAGSIINCSSTGAIICVEGEAREVGGLVGLNYSVISNCYSNVAVTCGDGAGVCGGLVGLNEGPISSCYSTGAVTCGDDVSNIGGLVGYHHRGSVSNCYSTGAVTCGENVLWVAGLVGGGSSSSGISNCYSAGKVMVTSSADRPGVIVVNGLAGGSRVYDSFWDIESSGLSESWGGTGKTTAEMMILRTYAEAGWDFAGETANGTEDIWKRPVKSYPMLSWQDYSVDLEDLGWMGKYWLEEKCDDDPFCFRADIAFDGEINFDDVMLLADSWLGDSPNYTFYRMFEDFETGVITAFFWEMFGDADWQTDSESVEGGSFAARSDPITDNQSTSIKTEHFVPDCTVSFHLKVSTELGYDFLQFLVDGVVIGQWSGQEDWVQTEFSIAEGQHVFEWRYSKDYDKSAGEDCVWLDNVVISRVEEEG